MSKKNGKIDLYRIENNFCQILEASGEDIRREGLINTPLRYAKFIREFLSPDPFNFTTFDAEGVSEMIVESKIPFYSLCEHHTLPFFGEASIGYIPNEKIAGLSKLPRALDMFSRRLQNQERITKQVCEFLADQLQTDSVIVLLRARHMCMEMRGVKKPGTETVTTCLSGRFEVPEVRAEFFQTINLIK